MKTQPGTAVEKPVVKEQPGTAGSSPPVNGLRQAQIDIDER